MRQLPWTLLVLAIGLIVWLSLALVNAENLRHALMTGVCADRVFKGEIDTRCRASVKSRESAWQHLAYALTHVRP